MKCSLGISNFLEEITSHSIIFLYFFALITEEGFLISFCYSLELCIQMGISFLFFFVSHFSSFHASLVAQRVKHLPAMPEAWVQSPGREDPLEEEMATHSSILVWRIPPWTEEPGGLQSTEPQRVGHN